jgi:hypothetical protein
MAVFIAGQNPEGTYDLAMTAVNCRPVITVTGIRIQRASPRHRGTPFRR